MRKILVPTDFSNNAINALKYAVELFKYDKSEFYIMHAYQDDIYADKELLTRMTINEVTKTIREKSQSQLEGILKQIEYISSNPRHSYHLVAANSMLLDESDKIVNDENIDIIIMGTRGQTNDRKLSFGSHTLQVLKYVQCPVLAIPENFNYTKPKHLLFPTNYMMPYKRRELKLLCEMVSPYRAEIDMLYISKSTKLSKRQEDNQKFIKEGLYKNNLNFRQVDANNISKIIYNYINEQNIDMLIMVNTRHSFLENILFQNTIDKMSLHVEIPFLSLQNTQRN